MYIHMHTYTHTHTWHIFFIHSPVDDQKDGEKTGTLLQITGNSFPGG